MTASIAPAGLDGRLAQLARQLVTWFESGARPAGMLHATAFADLTLPCWRLQADGAEAVFEVRRHSHPFPGQVRVEALDRTDRGFLIEFEERWQAEGQQWYSRELVHCVVQDGQIAELRVYCTGDWDEAARRRHAEQVQLVRP